MPIYPLRRRFLKHHFAGQDLSGSASISSCGDGDRDGLRAATGSLASAHDTLSVEGQLQPEDTGMSGRAKRGSRVHFAEDTQMLTVDEMMREASAKLSASISETAEESEESRATSGKRNGWPLGEESLGEESGSSMSIRSRHSSLRGKSGSDKDSGAYEDDLLGTELAGKHGRTPQIVEIRIKSPLQGEINKEPSFHLDEMELLKAGKNANQRTL